MTTNKEIPQNAWDLDEVQIIMDGLADLNPELRTDEPNEEIVIELPNDEEISIYRPDTPQWWYEVQYTWPVEPCGYHEAQGAFCNEQYVVKFVRDIVNQGGIRFREEL